MMVGARQNPPQQRPNQLITWICKMIDKYSRSVAAELKRYSRHGHETFTRVHLLNLVVSGIPTARANVFCAADCLYFTPLIGSNVYIGNFGSPPVLDSLYLPIFQSCLRVEQLHALLWREHLCWRLLGFYPSEVCPPHSSFWRTLLVSLIPESFILWTVL